MKVEGDEVENSESIKDNSCFFHIDLRRAGSILF